jgi:hypothetical protein
MFRERDGQRKQRLTRVLASGTGALAIIAGALFAAVAQEQPRQADTRENASRAVPTHSQDVNAQPQQASASDSYAGSDQWWAPGQGGTLGASQEFENTQGRLGLLNVSGAIDTKGHPFFEPLGKNGRACVTCHQPADGMSLSAATAQRRWQATGGKDPLFAAIDGSNCPHLPQDQESSHSLLLERGLIRVFLPWPPQDVDGKPLEPEFTLEVVADPTGCNTHPKYGLASSTPTVSVYRRPRVMANMKYVTSGGGSLFNIKDGSLMSRDPDTGKAVSMQLMADARAPTLKLQAIDAAMTHLQAARAPTDQQLRTINAFQNQIYVAQIFDRRAGDLVSSGPTALGPRAMADGSFGLGDNFATPVFGNFDAWRKPQPGETKEQQAFRESVARGSDVFFVRPFWIRDVTHLNTVGLGNPIKRTCATCHNSRMVGMDLAPGWMDLGTTNMPWSRTANNIAAVRNPWSHAYDEAEGHDGADHQDEGNDHAKELPLFKLTCKTSAMPHPFLGRVIYTQDPGRALINGRCRDIGAITIQQMRGLAARAPYFSNGSAKTLEELVEYYDQRFSAQYSEQEKRDLVNFLSVL